MVIVIRAAKWSSQHLFFSILILILILIQILNSSATRWTYVERSQNVGLNRIEDFWLPRTSLRSPLWPLANRLLVVRLAP